MPLLARARKFLRVVFRRRRADAELDAEVRSYFDMLVDRYIDQGMPLEDARRAARWEVEGVEQVKDRVRELRGGSFLETVPQDVRYAWRALRKSPAFTIVAILTLALGIGVNTAVFSVFHAVLLRPLPYDQPEQLGLIWSDFHKMGATRVVSSGPLLVEIQRRARLLKDAGGIWITNATFTGDQNPEQVKVGLVTTNFLDVLGVRPALGRLFSPEEAAGGRSAVILTDGLWRTRFGADPKIVGQAVRTPNGSTTVIGVLRPDFKLVPADVQAFIPFNYDLARSGRTVYFLRILARLKPGVDFARAQQELNSVAAQVRGAYSEYAAESVQFEIVPLHADVVRDVRPALIALFSGAGLVLLICCVNVANLLLARASDRRREVAVRVALGASRARILRQLLIEGLILCFIAGTAGLAIGWAGLRGLLSLRSDYLTQAGGIGLNWSVLAFVAAISLTAALVFGLAPGIESAKWDLTKTLSQAGRHSQGFVRRRFRAALIVCEVAIGFVLLIGAGLMIRTLANVERIRPGFETANVLTFDLGLQGKKYRSTQALTNFVKAWDEKLASLPGVEAAGASYDVPLGNYPNWYSPYRPEGMTESQASGMLADHRCITPDYLRALGVPLLAGRYFDDGDRADGRQVVIVDDLLASATWPGQSALGKRIESEHVKGDFEPVWAEVVGVVEHTRNQSLTRIVRPTVYIPYDQSARNHLAYAVRTRVDPLSLVQPIRNELRKLDADLAVSKVHTMAEYRDEAMAPVSFTTMLAAVFAGLALLLAAVGIYGVIYYSVSRRTSEMGLRMALGAKGGDIVHLVLREGMTLTVCGMAIGIGAALAISRYMDSLLYGISDRDPFTYAAAIVVIVAAAVLGCWRPAAKAARVNPAEAMRAE